MSTVDDSAEYYRMRERQERENAAKAASGEAKAIHKTLADRYQALAGLADENPRA